MQLNNQVNESCEKPSFSRMAAGVAAGGVAAGLFGADGPIVKQVSVKLMQSIPQNTETAKACKDIFERPEIKKHKIALIECTSETIDKIKKNIDDLPFPKLIKNFQHKIYDLVLNGNNAFYNFKINSIIINPEKLGTSVFHEVGHAINNKTSKFWRSIQKSRLGLVSILPGAFLMTALFKSKKPEGEQPKGFFDRTTTVIKDNVGKLTTLAFVPVIAEEIKASLCGQKLAKEMLSPENYKNVVKSNKMGILSYVIGAGLAGFGAYLGNKMRDAIVKPRTVE